MGRNLSPDIEPGFFRYPVEIVMRFARSSLAAVILFAAAGTAQEPPEAGDLRVDGTVVDADTGQPLANARVQIFLPKTVPGLRGTPDAVASSDKDGSFRIPLTRRHACFRGSGEQRIRRSGLFADRAPMFTLRRYVPTSCGGEIQRPRGSGGFEGANRSE